MIEHTGFGLVLRCPWELPGRWCAPPAGPVVDLCPGPEGACAARFSGDASPGWAGVIDGTRFTVSRGRAGDLLMVQDGVSAFLLDADRATLHIDGEQYPGIGALRTLLDSVWFTVALELGFEALHGGGLESDAGVVAVLGDSGAGKSTLGTVLRRRGLRFFTDDILVLGRCDDIPVAHPGPPVATVPAALPGDRPVLADLGPERWVAETGARQARPIAAVVLLTAGGTPPASLAMEVLRHAQKFPAARHLERFDMVADVVQGATVLPVGAHSAPPDELADRILDALAARGVEAG